jgi:hypothetical protein
VLRIRADTRSMRVIAAENGLSSGYVSLIRTRKHLRNLP